MAGRGAFLLVAVFAIGGCSAQAVSTAPPASTASPTPSASPAPTPSPTLAPSPTINITLLAQNYSALERKRLDADIAIWSDYGARVTLREQNAIDSGYADADEAFMTALGKQLFPESMQSDLQQVYKTVDAERTIEIQISSASTWAVADSLTTGWKSASTASMNAINQLAHDLGLGDIEQAIPSP